MYLLFHAIFPISYITILLLRSFHTVNHKYSVVISEELKKN